MIPGIIARRYATALLELGVETNTLDALVDEIGRAAQAYDTSPELRSALADPLVPIQAKHAILAEVGQRLGLGQASKNVFKMLLDRRRVQAIVPIAQRLKEMADDKRGVVRAEVLTAMPLPEEYFTQLQQQLERVTGRRIALDRKLDPTLICGVVARVGDTIYDGSLMSRLRQIKDSMLPN
ncbi:MAG: ATP synthase F1 subunit delta [Labilithrix sp.]|nr:ATP synthase F1 subunit delta [Labilithrix sp.]MCW5817698.1 ATP synthase F1 subunit delta [Labilithrix sp.]